MAGVPDGRGPKETCLRRCSHALLLSNWGFGALCASTAGAGSIVWARSEPVQAIIAPTSAAVEQAPRTLRTGTPKAPCTDIRQTPRTDIVRNLRTSALRERHVIPPLVADVDLLRPRDLLIGVEQHLLPLRHPARRSRNRK